MKLITCKVLTTWTIRQPLALLSSPIDAHVDKLTKSKNGRRRGRDLKAEVERMKRDHLSQPWHMDVCFPFVLASSSIAAAF